MCVSLQKGLVQKNIYNIEFIKHRSTDIVIDFRNLCDIKKIEEFIKMCSYLKTRDELEKELFIIDLD